MGIPFYFASLIKSHRGITQVINNPLEVDVLGIDFNCLIHRYLIDENPIGSVVDALEYILKNICKAKKVLIAIDGLVPYAKIVQQRYRRFAVKTETSVFDRNQISPDTPYMRELEKALISRFPYAHISGTSEPGEGEHKLFQMIRGLQENERKNVCIYGLDADLILICLQHHGVSQHMDLLRESAEFNDPSLKQAEFSTLDISKLEKTLPMNISQYIALSILCFGNDFMPNLGMFSLREDGYSRAIHIYEESGNPDLLTFEGRDVFLNCALKHEMVVLKERIKLRKRPEEKALLGNMFSKKYRLHNLDGVQDMKFVVDAYWKTFHWSLYYFQTNKVLNWDWVYPYPDAPLVADILNYDETEIESGELNYTITKQLQFILPTKSLRTAKRLVMFPNEFHTETRNPWMKRHDWEMDPRISLPWNPSQSLTSICHL